MNKGINAKGKLSTNALMMNIGEIKKNCMSLAIYHVHPINNCWESTLEYVYIVEVQDKVPTDCYHITHPPINTWSPLDKIRGPTISFQILYMGQRVSNGNIKWTSFFKKLMVNINIISPTIIARTDRFRPARPFVALMGLLKDQGFLLLY